MAQHPHEDESYWRSSISRVTPEKVFIRRYDLEDLIGGLSFTSASLLLIKGRLPSPRESRVLDAVLTAVLDYALHKSGTAAARYVVSGNPRMVAGLAAATMAVGEYTLATEDTARFIADTHDRFLESGEDQEVFAAKLVESMSANKERVLGLGHPVFKKVDPRAAILRETAIREGLWNEPAQACEAVHRAFTARPGKADIPLNEVGTMAAVLVTLGFTPEEREHRPGGAEPDHRNPRVLVPRRLPCFGKPAPQDRYAVHVHRAAVLDRPLHLRLRVMPLPRPRAHRASADHRARPSLHDVREVPLPRRRTGRGLVRHPLRNRRLLSEPADTASQTTEN
ncbi:citrate/2-methylcitrate synthase [Streptomyces sp. NPDC095613]|uniref:citrate/2-methylcitrate synthase n=1 Tax=Streptomyces sp. NPDC095613 TaxID=3155540 RepID=UPI00332245FF